MSVVAGCETCGRVKMKTRRHLGGGQIVFDLEKLSIGLFSGSTFSIKCSNAVYIHVLAEFRNGRPRVSAS